MVPSHNLTTHWLSATLLRRLFLIGFAVWCLLFFVPYSRYFGFISEDAGWATKMGRWQGKVSMYGFAGFLVERGRLGTFLLVALAFGLRLLITIAAFKRPSLIVYRAGATFAALMAFIALLAQRNTSGGQTRIVAVLAVEVVAVALCLSGFLFKSQTPAPTSTKPQ